MIGSAPATYREFDERLADLLRRLDEFEIRLADAHLRPKRVGTMGQPSDQESPALSARDEHWQHEKRTHVQEPRPTTRPAAHVPPQRVATRGQSQSRNQIPPEVPVASIIMVNVEASRELIDRQLGGEA